MQPRCLGFPTPPAEVRLVMALRQAGRLTESHNGAGQGQIVGHVAFLPVSSTSGPTGVDLPPLTVASTHRRQGIGTQLVSVGLEASRHMGHTWSLVLGEPGFDGRFGFLPAPAFALADSYGGGEAFQVIELQLGAIPVGAGLVSHSPEFSLLAQRECRRRGFQRAQPREGVTLSTSRRR